MDFSILTYSKNILNSASDLISLFQNFSHFQNQDKKERFLNLVKPIHNKFQEVHEDYYAMFTNLKQSLPVEINNGIYSVPKKTNHLTERKAVEFAKKLIRNFETERSIKIGTRDWIRNNSQAIFTNLNNYKEQRYFHSLAMYFLDAQFVKNPEKYIVEANVESLIKRGGNAVFDTPSFKLLKDLESLENIAQINEYLDHEIVRLGERCREVLRSYNEFL